MIPILPLITRAGAMLMLKLRAKRAARKKILKDAALKKKVDKIGKKAAKKEAKKKEPKKKVPKKKVPDEEESKRIAREYNSTIKRIRKEEEGKKPMEWSEFDEIMKREKYKHDLQKEAKRRRN